MSSSNNHHAFTLQEETFGPAEAAKSMPTTPTGDGGGKLSYEDIKTGDMHMAFPF